MNSVNEQTSYQQHRLEVGAELKSVRQENKKSKADIAAQLRTTVSIVSDLESGCWDRLGSDAYGRAFVKSYARQLGVELENLDACMEPPRGDDVDVREALQSRRRYQNFQQVQRFAAYTAATSLIAIPLVFLIAMAFRGQITPADNGPVALDQPVLASMLPALTPLHRPLTLTAEQHSRIEVFALDGQPRWSGELRAGQSRQFASKDGILVRIGNPKQVRAQLDGTPLELAPYRLADSVELRIPPVDPSTDR